MVATTASQRWFDKFKEIWFRRLAILLMFTKRRIDIVAEP
jgi:hypothetical protein